MKVIMIGDIFGNRSLESLEKYLPKLIKNKNINFVVAQGENVSGRKGLTIKDFNFMKKIGIDAITMGNHIWAKKDIQFWIDQVEGIVRPLNIDNSYPGVGSHVFLVKGKKIRVTSLLGQTFNPLNKNSGWEQEKANNFFDAFDIINNQKDFDYHLIDFHAETTSEKNVFSLYADGKADVVVGTHTHVQTNDARILPKGTIAITDLGMVGPINSAIGASYETVYKKMRFDEMIRFKVSKNNIQFNALIIDLDKKEFELINEMV
ncbi:MAG: YmdB family metallophosphoesterase [Mollicutes bacterium PWAP]|nr:YmdB family metallophosphoesterase [Mollicutes bacterium PWAP]